ncbi:MAG: protoheme IX farnesyltransferase [Hyphomicrobiales bacterium]|nr:protoheme IX farnesyltransferase [Hyphomicrobiales bacterium]
MQQPHRWTKEELAVRRKRSIVIAIVLVAVMILFYVTTIVRLGGNVADRVF